MLLIIGTNLLENKRDVKSADTSCERVHELSIRINADTVIRYFHLLWIHKLTHQDEFP